MTGSGKAATGRGRHAALMVSSGGGNEDFEYVSGAQGLEPAVLLCSRRGAELVVSRMEYRHALRVVSGVVVYTPEMLRAPVNRAGDPSAWALALARKNALRAVRVRNDFPLGLAEKLKRAGIAVQCAGETLCPQREIKTGREIRNIAEAQQAAVIALRAAAGALARAEIDERGFLQSRGQRVTAEDLRALIGQVLFNHQCVCRDVIIACGPAGADPHERGEGPLRAGEPIVIDIFPRHQGHGYWGDLTRTIVRGTAPTEVRRMYQAVRCAQAAAIASVRPGVRCAAVRAAAEKEIARRGFAAGSRGAVGYSMFQPIGHGIGLALHEKPHMGDPDVRLQNGQVISIEPGLYSPRVGGVRLEDVGVVTSQGWTYLVPCERRLEV